MATEDHSPLEYTFEAAETKWRAASPSELWEFGWVRASKDGVEREEYEAARKEGTDLVYYAQRDASGELIETVIGNHQPDDVPQWVRDEVGSGARRSNGSNFHEDYQDLESKPYRVVGEGDEQWMIALLQDPDTHKPMAIAALDGEGKAYALDIEFDEDGAEEDVWLRDMFTGDIVEPDEASEQIPVDVIMAIGEAGEVFGFFGDRDPDQALGVEGEDVPTRLSAFKQAVAFEGLGLSDEDKTLLQKPDEELTDEERTAKEILIAAQVAEFESDLDEALDLGVIAVAKGHFGELAYQASHRGMYSERDTNAALDRLSALHKAEAALLAEQQTDAEEAAEQDAAAGDGTQVTKLKERRDRGSQAER